MRRALRFLVLLGLLVMSSQAEARGGGGGGSAVGRGGCCFHGVAVVPGSRGFNQPFFRQSLLPVGGQRLGSRRLPNALNNTERLPLNGGAWAGYWWDNQWWPAGGYASAPDTVAAQPQVIAIHTDPDGHTSSEVAPDYGYVSGCHVILNGYHCDTGRTAP